MSLNQENKKGNVGEHTETAQLLPHDQRGFVLVFLKEQFPMQPNKSLLRLRGASNTWHALSKGKEVH